MPPCTWTPVEATSTPRSVHHALTTGINRSARRSARSRASSSPACRLASIVAAAALQRDAGGFGAAKLATARFYAEHFLARAPSYLPGIRGGATVVE